MALPMTLFFVLMAFFVASAVLARAHFEARATVLEANAIQQEGLARAALSTLQAKLNAAGGEDKVEEFTLKGPSGMTARAWFEEGDNELFRLYASVEGSGRPFRAQKVVRKMPVLDALDVVHLSDGKIETPDGVKMRVARASNWSNLTSPGVSLFWIHADRRGNIFANDFPAVSTETKDGLPPDFLKNFVAKNADLVQSGRINFEFVSHLAQAIEDNRSLNLNADLGGGIGGTLGGQGGPVGPGTNPEYIKPTLTVVDVVAKGAKIQHYSSEKGVWESIPVPFQQGVTGQIPGSSTSDGKKLYLPMMQPGPDRLLSFDLKSRQWSNLPSPGAVSGSGSTRKILEVEVDDSGFLYCRHSDGEDIGLSVFEPESSTWSRLPSPPGLYATGDGKVRLLQPEAKVWGALEVDEAGDLFVVWRAPSESEVQKYVVGGSGSSEVPGVASGESSGGALAGVVLKTPRDMILKYRKGEWSVLAGMTDPLERLGSFAAGPDGRFLLQDIRAAADRLLSMDGEGKIDSNVFVTDLDGEQAHYFTADSGGKPIQGRFKFAETAEF